MKIQEVTKYVYKGKEYKSLKEIKEVVHNTIGEEVIDKINRVCPPEQHKNLFNMLDVLCQPEVRKVLTDCLNVTFEEVVEIDVGFNDTEEINILDI